ncbi:hypothetical protein RirG_210580 [Rhizophagus irregularis DAOM 197198w]|uniref:SWIM-type domain-containing protein n=3 Tax=Rhizophagus irregularis TaxID=588596 RepID=A0A015JPW5_RHIIW|nr:hypothetical protein RirG_210580 [Rhizophagus irregularis DAOM 197198w]
MISEVIPPIESSNYDNHDNNEDNESTTLFAENILGFNFKDCVRSLPLINTPIKLEVGTSFYSMTIAIHYIEQFTLQNNFAIFKHKSEKFLDGTCRKKVLKCNLGGRYTQKLSRPTSDKMTMKGSKKQGCKWQINITRPSNSSIVTVTQFHSEHNHKISTETLQFAPTYRTFPEEIMDQIEFYVIHDRCDASIVRNLLQPKYPDHVFLIQDLGNAIQKIKWENGISLDDAAFLLLKLFDLQANNPAWFVKLLLDDTSNRLISIFWMLPEQRERWIKFYDIIIHDNTAKTNKYNYPLSLFILIDNYNKSRLAAQAFLQDERQESYEWLLRCCLEACKISLLTFVTDGDSAMIAAVSTVFPEAHHMQCLFHLYQNLPKNLRSCLGSSLYQEFLKDFRAVQRSHCEKVFEQRSQNLVEKYAAEERYISTVLLNRKHTWRVESENALIKKAIQSSFFLLQAQEAIENRLEFESINTRYSIWKTSTLQYTQSLIIQTFFSGIDSIMKKYLTQPIHDAHYKQMCQSVCYFMHQVSIAEALTLDDDSFKPIFDGEDSAETFAEIDEDRELDLQSLMAMVNIDDIIEIWKISRYNYPKTYQFVILLSTGEHLCTCFMLITHGIVCRHFFKVFVKSSKARFHLTLIPCRWYKDEYISLSEGYFNEKVIGNRNFNYSSTFEFTRKYTINDLSEEYSKQITRKQLKYGILMGEAKKAIQFAICDDDEELIKLIKEYNKRKKTQYIQAESVKQQRALAN